MGKKFSSILFKFHLKIKDHSGDLQSTMLTNKSQDDPE